MGFIVIGFVLLYERVLWLLIIFAYSLITAFMLFSTYWCALLVCCLLAMVWNDLWYWWCFVPNGLSFNGTLYCLAIVMLGLRVGLRVLVYWRLR